MPYVSVIVPVYNTEQYLNRCLDSLINQTLKDIEIICINDGSTDNSLNILKEYANKDNRIVIIDNKHSGVGATRNLGLKKATGTYIGFCDSDDYVDTTFYENLYNFSKQIPYDIIRGRRVIEINRTSYKNPYGCIVPSLIRKDFLMHIHVKFPENIQKGEDSYFKRRLYAHQPKVYETPDTKSYYHYMRREGSLSNYKLHN